MLDTLDLGFNAIKTRGMMLLMKVIADSPTLKTLSLSGNSVDTNSAKAITYALVYNQSLATLNLVGCEIGEEGQRQIVAGIVSNPRTSLREFSGFNVGPVIVTLGFPGALTHWSNDHVFNFIHLMWTKTDADMLPPAQTHEEKSMDPLNFLEGDETNQKPTPLEATVVVEIANKTFTALVEDGVDVFSRIPGDRSKSTASSSPIVGDTVAFESAHSQNEEKESHLCCRSLSPHKTHSFIAPPEDTSLKSVIPDPSRKKRIVEWLCVNIEHLNNLAQLPFSSSELARLHQRYFTPVVNESGGNILPSPRHGSEVIKASSSTVRRDSLTLSSSDSVGANSESLLHHSGETASPSGMISLPMMKRKVSYRCLGDAALASAPRLESSSRQRTTQVGSVTALIDEGLVSHTLPRRTKRARRNRSRISFCTSYKRQTGFVPGRLPRESSHNHAPALLCRACNLEWPSQPHRSLKNCKNSSLWRLCQRC